MSKTNVTISLAHQTVEKLRSLAARRATSISGLVTERIEVLVREDEVAYERAQRQAMALFDQGFPMGGVTRANRDEVHER
jgi:hypothetical protein